MVGWMGGWVDEIVCAYVACTCNNICFYLFMYAMCVCGKVVWLDELQ